MMSTMQAGVLNRMASIQLIENQDEEPVSPLDFPEFSQPNKEDEWYNDVKAWQNKINIPMRKNSNLRGSFRDTRSSFALQRRASMASLREPLSAIPVKSSVSSAKLAI
jgi:hypothetical protein